MFKQIRETLYRLTYINAPRLNLDKPVDVSLELTSSCNQRCEYCYHADQGKLPFSKGFMNPDLAKKIIRQASSLGVNSIKMNYRGESTLHPDFASICLEAKSLAHGSTFIDRLTNSNFKFDSKREDIFRGLSYQTKVKVSFDSFIPTVMEKQRRGSIHSVALENIDRFYNHSLRKKSETKIVIQAVRTQLNKDEDIAGEVKRRWSEAKVSIRDMVSGRIDKDLSSLEHIQRDASERQSCIQAHARLIIHHDGKVGVCCPDIAGKLIVGDANKELIYDIFNSQKAKQLRENLKSKAAFAHEPCKSCASYESYKGYKAPFNS